MYFSFLLRFTYKNYENEDVNTVQVYMKDDLVAEKKFRRNINAESLPFMATKPMPTNFPINIKVESKRKVWGYVFLSPIEYNIGKKLFLKNIYGKLNMIIHVK